MARGRTIVLHCWKTDISISGAAHLAFVTNHCAYIEYLPPQLCHERLRRELAQEELVLRPDGTIPVPVEPGLGVEIDLGRGQALQGRLAEVEMSANSSQRLKGRVAVVTGAAQGIGFGIAALLADEGAVLVIADINEKNARDGRVGDLLNFTKLCETDG